MLRIIFSGIIFIICGIIIGILSCGGDSTGPDGDLFPPTVTATSPDSNATNVSIDAVITATFSEPLANSSVTTATFYLNNGATGTVTYVNNTATLSPTSLLNYNVLYTATITQGVTDTSGNGLSQNYSWSFRTESDPSLTLPVISATSPSNGATNVSSITTVRATFSKAMDPATLDNTSFYLNNGATGTVTYSDNIATLTPDSLLSYSTVYTATVTTAVSDTFGINMASLYNWSFTTEVDPSIPTATIFLPLDSTIVSDTVEFFVNVSAQVEMAEYFLDDTTNLIGTMMLSPFNLNWDASSLELGSEHYLFMRVSDSAGNVGYSDSVLIFYQWQELMTDINDPWPTDIKRVLYRPSDSLLELRYEFWGNWSNPYNDTSLNIATYFDADNNEFTGRTDFQGTYLNDIGAEYRMIIGFVIIDTSAIDKDTVMAFWNASATPPFWDFLFDTTGLAYHNVPQDTNVMEIGIRWSDFNYPTIIRLVAINIFFSDINSWITDWVPNEGSGYMSIENRPRYKGTATFPKSNKTGKSMASPTVDKRLNPFK